MKKFKKGLIQTVILTLGTASSYVMAKPMVAECELHCTLLCRIVGLCTGTGV